MAEQLELFTDPIPDFDWYLTFGGIRYDFTMAECNDGSPWVGYPRVDGVDTCWSVIEEYMIENWDMTEAAAEAWIESALQSRLDFEREKIKGNV